MGIFGLFGNKKNDEANQEQLEKEALEKKQSEIEEIRKAHEDLEWPVIQRINPVNIKDEEGDMVEETVPAERKNEIGELIYKEEITQDDIAPLNGQELLFLLTALEVFNKKAPLPEYEKNHRKVYNEVLSRVREAEYLFVLYDTATGFPYVDHGLGNVYFEEEVAKRACEVFGKQFRKLAVKKCPVEDPNFKGSGKGSFFDYLFYIGIDNLVVDNGAYRARFKRNEIVANPGEWGGAQQMITPANPALNFAMIDFLEELRWPVKYERRDEVIKAKEVRMLSLIRSAQFIIPTQHEGPTDVGEDGRIKIGKDTKLKFPVLRTNEDKQFLPVFTDPFEFSKNAANKEWNAGVFRYQDVLRFAAEKDGVVINPQGQSLVLTRDRMMALEMAGQQADILKAKNRVGKTAAASTNDAVNQALSQAMSEMKKEDE